MELYLTHDTCVWLELLKADIHCEDNLFEEILFWIEQGHIACVTTPNLIREWDRHKISKKEEILLGLKRMDEHFAAPFKANTGLNSVYQPDRIEDILIKRIERLDRMFKTIAINADQEDAIIAEAVKRNLDCIAPNTTKDSFRDTVNILHLTNFIQRMGYNPCYFCTINYKDFSAKDDKHTMHHQLAPDFSSANLEYIYFDSDPKNYAGRFINILRGYNLPSFSDYLKEKQRKEEERLLSEKKAQEKELRNITDPEFLENLSLLDIILRKPAPNKTDEKILEMLFEQHPGYREYFMKNLGKDGMA